MRGIRAGHRAGLGRRSEPLPRLAREGTTGPRRWAAHLGGGGQGPRLEVQHADQHRQVLFQGVVVGLDLDIAGHHPGAVARPRSEAGPARVEVYRGCRLGLPPRWNATSRGTAAQCPGRPSCVPRAACVPHACAAHLPNVMPLPSPSAAANASAARQQGATPKGESAQRLGGNRKARGHAVTAALAARRSTNMPCMRQRRQRQLTLGLQARVLKHRDKRVCPLALLHAERCVVERRRGRRRRGARRGRRGRRRRAAAWQRHAGPRRLRGPRRRWRRGQRCRLLLAAGGPELRCGLLRLNGGRLGGWRRRRRRGRRLERGRRHPAKIYRRGGRHLCCRF